MGVNTNGYRKLGSGPAGSRAPIRSEHGDSFAGDDPTFHGLQRRETSARDSNVRNPSGLFGQTACCYSDDDRKRRNCKTSLSRAKVRGWALRIRQCE